MPDQEASVFKHWARNNTNIGIFVRRARRVFHTLANKQHRLGNVAMLHAGRCGSSVLADLLGQHPLFRWSNEPFESMIPAYRNMNPNSRASHLLGNLIYLQNTPYFGFDSKYLPEQHLNPDYANKSISEYIALLDSLGFNYFILLNRKNHLRRAVSTAIGQKNGLWNSTNAPRKSTTVHLNAERFVSYGKQMSLVDFFRSLDEAYTRLLGCLKNHSVLELTYEQDIQNDPKAAYLRTCDFLSLEPAPVDVRLKRMNPKPIGALIENFDEIYTLLSGTEYAWMLEE